MSHEPGFIRALIEEEDDLAPLAFSDWLEENGQPERAEFLRVQTELARWVPRRSERQTLQQREAQLLAEHAQTWLGPLAHRCSSWRYRGGLAYLTLSARAFLELPAEAEQWFARGWVRRVRVENGGPLLNDVVRSPLFRAVPELDLSRELLEGADLHTLLAGDWVGTLVGLDLSVNRLSQDLFVVLLRNPQLQRLRWIDLHNTSITLSRRMIDWLRDNPESLPRLELHNNPWPNPIAQPTPPGRAPTRVGGVLTNSVDMRLAWIPVGDFLMGAPEDEQGSFPNEKPQHAVRLPRSFFLGAFPVTQQQFQRVLGQNPSRFQPSGSETPARALFRPVENVTWEEAIEFCEALSALREEKNAGRVYRLPTEAEWEYACRAGTTTPFHFGESICYLQANFSANHPYGGGIEGPWLERTTDVGSYPPNDFGLYDMHGNVWEWVADHYRGDYYSESPDVDPAGPESGQGHVLRGGSWYIVGRGCRSAERCYTDEAPVRQPGTIGFRVAMDFPRGA